MRHDPASGAIVIMLRELKMHGMANAVSELAQQASPAFDAAQPILSQLLKAETAEREVRSVSYQLKLARFPVYRDLAGFDFGQSEVNEALVTGRERVFFGAEFAASAGSTKLPDEAAKYYVDTLAANPEALRGSFEFYRAIPTSAAQNEERKNRRLMMPVMAIGGEQSGGENAANAMRLVADDVQTVVLEGAGHWVAEQAPEELVAALTGFLAEYRDAN